MISHWCRRKTVKDLELNLGRDLAFTAPRPEPCQFRTILWYLLERKSSMIYSKFLIYSFVLILMSHLDVRLCHTLFICQGKTSVTSQPSSKYLQISWVIAKSWFIQESPVLNPDWIWDIISFQWKKKTCCTAKFQRFSHILQEVSLIYSSLLIFP